MLRIMAVLLVVLATMSVACGNNDPTTDNTGKTGIALSLPVPNPMVGGFLLDVYTNTCPVEGQTSPNPVAHTCATLETMNYPVNGVSLADGHPFADYYFLLWPGTYCVVAKPVTSCDDEGTGHEIRQCSPAKGTQTVTSGYTEDLELESNCDLIADSGGLDVAAKVNRDPWIDDPLTFNPDKYICVGSSLTVTAIARDYDADTLYWRWTGPYSSQDPAACSPAPGPDPTSSTLTCGPQAFPLQGTQTMVVHVCDSPFLSDVCPTEEAVLEFQIHVVTCPGRS